MKRMKKLIANLVGGLMMVMPILATPIFAQAKTVSADFGNWRYYDYATGDYVDSGIPISVTVNSSDDDFEFWGGYFEYMDEDVWVANNPDEDPEELAYYAGCWSAEFWVEAEWYFEVGDTVVVQLPFSGSIYDWELYDEDDWDVAFGSNSITFTCIEKNDEIDVEWMMYKKGVSSEEDQFWFKPMKTQLNIAAEIASASGKEAVAEVSGDFGLSYEIMKWLEDHPNVTLKYNLTYKEKDYNIVIKGGQKLANPEIPWYGPEYLIGKFSK